MKQVLAPNELFMECRKVLATLQFCLPQLWLTILTSTEFRCDHKDLIGLGT
jgi:hypothetical protein